MSASGVTRWRKKPVEVEMILWDGSEEAWQLIANHGGLPERLPDGSINIWVEASQAEMNLDPGAWAIIEQDGSGVYPCRAADHATTYEPVTDRAGTDGLVHYDVTRTALIAALGNHPLTAQPALQARGKFADVILAQMPEASRVALRPAQRVGLGTLVRAIWVSWASEQPDAKPSWLTGWDELDDGQREVDMRIGEMVAEVARTGERERIAELATDRGAVYPVKYSPGDIGYRSFADLIRGLEQP